MESGSQGVALGWPTTAPSAPHSRTRLGWNACAATPIVPRAIEALAGSRLSQPQIRFFNFSRREEFGFAQEAGFPLQLGVHFQIHRSVNRLADGFADDRGTVAAHQNAIS